MKLTTWGEAVGVQAEADDVGWRSEQFDGDVFVKIEAAGLAAIRFH